MTIRPRFRPCYHLEVIPSEGVFLLSEDQSVVLGESVHFLLAPLLTGQHTISEIIEQLRGRVAPQDIIGTLLTLRRQGYIIDSSPRVSLEQAAFDDMLDTEHKLVADRLQNTCVSVTALGSTDPAPLLATLEALGLRVSDSGDYRVVLTDDYLHAGLEAINARALDDGRPWLLVKPLGRSVWLGPVFIPEQTGCWRCLAHRQRGHRKIDTFVQARRQLSAPIPTSRAALPTTLQVALNLTATEVYKWVLRGLPGRLEGCVRTLDTVTLEWQSHQLVRRPQCRACGEPGYSDAQSTALTLHSRKKVFTADGGHRSVAPHILFERLTHHISPVSGIVASLHPSEMDGRATPVTPSYVADYGSIDASRDMAGLLDGLYRRAGGKGRTHEQARMSALGEAIERYSGAFQGDEPRIRASFASLGARAIHPNSCMHFSRRQFDNREESNSNSTRSTWVAEPMDESLEIDWSPIYSLTHGTTRYLPTAYCYYGYSDRHDVEFARANSNGCAAGSNKEEAILQGFMELVERDGVAIWWYNQLKRPGVDLDSFDEPYIHELRTRYRAMHRDLWVLDVSSDIAIPIFAAVSRRTDKPVEDIILGFGAHLEPRTALLRALTELNQSLPPVSSVTAGGDEYIGVNERAINWWRTATIDNQPYLCPDASAALRSRSDYPNRATDDLRDDISVCVQHVQTRGLETLVCDQTRADIGLSVVKVIVPGMRHFWPRFAPGRLYDVPVAMGWLETARHEEELNSAIVYF